MYSWDYAHLRTAPTGYEPLEHAPTRAAVRAVYSLVVFTPPAASLPLPPLPRALCKLHTPENILHERQREVGSGKREKGRQTSGAYVGGSS